jgi:hypothetical protein
LATATAGLSAGASSRRALTFAAALSASALAIARSALAGTTESARQTWLREAAKNKPPAEKFG